MQKIVSIKQVFFFLSIFYANKQSENILVLLLVKNIKEEKRIYYTFWINLQNVIFNRK